MAKQKATQPDTATKGQLKTAAGWWLAFSALALGLALGYAAARYVGKDQASHQYEQLKTSFDVTLAQSQFDLNAALTQLDAMQGQMVVEQSTRQGLESTLEATQHELGRARDQLAFFNQLLPPGPNGSVSVRALDVEQQGPILKYRVLLMRNAPGGDMFNGLMEFTANGMEKGKAVKIKLAPIQVASTVVSTEANDAANPLALSFEQFQRSEGLLSIPDGFAPKSVTVNVLDGKTLRVSRTVNVSFTD